MDENEAEKLAKQAMARAQEAALPFDPAAALERHVYGGGKFPHATTVPAQAGVWLFFVLTPTLTLYGKSVALLLLWSEVDMVHRRAPSVVAAMVP